MSNSEIKEILIKDFNEILVKEFCTDWKEKRLYIELLVNSTPFSNLLDYITNLQQENERLKQPKIFIDTQDMEERYGEELYKDYLEKQVKDYKSRIEKAVEYIMSELIDEWSIKNDGCVDGSDLPANAITPILDILNGRSDE